MGLFTKKRPASIPYDPAAEQPAVRKSICTGEMTVGFIDRKTGKFRDVMMAANQRELDGFLKQIGAKSEDLKTIY